MKTFVPALLSLSLLSSVVLATPDASDEAAQAMAEALAAVGSAKALAPPPSATPPPRREPVRDRAQDSGCSTTPGSTTAIPFVLVALAVMQRRSRKGVGV